MPQYVRKSLTVEARLFDPDSDHAEDVLSWAGAEKDEGFTWEIRNPDSTWMVISGYYVVKLPDGTFEVWSQTKMREEYEEV